VVATHSAVAVTGRTLTAQAEDPSAALISVLTALNEAGIELHDAGIRRPTLDDVFLTLTGHAIEEQEVAA
jgi:putative ABC transporter, ATP-binding protein